MSLAWADLIQTPNACTTTSVLAYSTKMKEELLDLDAILSLATAEFSMPTPDLARALAHLDQARGKILDLAEGLEDSQKN